MVLADGTDDVVTVDDQVDDADVATFGDNNDDIDWLTKDQFEAIQKAGLKWLDSSELTAWDAVRTKVSDIDYQIWEYETNADGDLYTLTGRETRYAEDVEINNGKAYIDSPVTRDDILIDNSTIFVDVEGNVAYTGYEAVPDVSNAKIAYVLEDDSARGVAEIVYIIDGDFYDADAIYFVITSVDRDSEKYDGDYYFEFDDMYVDGHRQTGMFVSYDALIDAKLTPSLDKKDADADTDKTTDKEIKDNMVGEVFKVLKSEDGKYITEIQHVNAWRWTQTATNSALWVYKTGLNGTDKYTTNGDTTYVVVEATYDRKDNFDGWDVYEGGYDDIITYDNRNSAKNDGYITLVQVVKADDGTAELVYILKYIPATVYDVLFYGNHDAFTWSGAEQYEEGSDYTGTITAAEGYDIDNVTVTKGAEYVTLTKVDENTWNVAIADIAADVAIQVDVKAEVQTFTLTLSAPDFFDATPARVYLGDGTGSALTPSKTNTSFGQTVSVEYTIEAGQNVTVVHDTDKLSFVMDRNITIDENALGVQTGDKVTVTVDGKVVKYVDKSNASAPDYTVTPTTGTSFKMQYAGTTSYWSYSTPVNNANLTGNIEIETGYVTVTDNASAVSGYATYNGANYIKANTGVLTFTAAGTYSINGEVLEDVSVGDTYTVGDKNVVIDAYQTAAQLDKTIETAWASVISGGTKGPDHVSDGTMVVDLTTNTITLTSDAGEVISNTGLVDLANKLLAAGYEITVATGDDSVTLSGSVDSDDLTNLKDMLPSGGMTRNLTVTVTNDNNQSVTYTVVYTQAK